MSMPNIAGDQLRSFIERVEKLEEDKAALAQDVREVFAEAKGSGFDVKTMRYIVKLRKMDASDRDEAEYLLDTYKRAMGMQPDMFASADGEPANRICITTASGVIDTDVDTFIKATKMTDQIVNLLGAIYQNGGFAPKTEADEKLITFLDSMELVNVRSNGSCLVKPSAYSRYLEKQRA